MPTANVNSLDIAIATMLNTDLKNCVASCAKSACECTTPEIRREFARISQEGIERQERLAVLMSQKGIYVAPRADHETVGLIMPQIQAAIAGLQGVAGVTTNGATAGDVQVPRTR